MFYQCLEDEFHLSRGSTTSTGDENIIQAPLFCLACGTL